MTIATTGVHVRAGITEEFNKEMKMKVEQKKEFNPVVITLETADEVRAIRVALNHSSSANLYVIELDELLNRVTL